MHSGFHGGPGAADGQPGWENFFLRAGHDVYVSDAVERGRASWARYPEMFKSEPFFRLKKEAWELLRIGDTDSCATDPARHRALPGAQFPWPRSTSSPSSTRDACDRRLPASSRC